MGQCPQSGTLTLFFIGSLKSANSVGNKIAGESLQKKHKAIAIRRKGSPPTGAWIMQYIHYLNTSHKTKATNKIHHSVKK